MKPIYKIFSIFVLSDANSPRTLLHHPRLRPESFRARRPPQQQTLQRTFLHQQQQVLLSYPNDLKHLQGQKDDLAGQPRSSQPPVRRQRSELSRPFPPDFIRTRKWIAYGFRCGRLRLQQQQHSRPHQSTFGRGHDHKEPLRHFAEKVKLF